MYQSRRKRKRGRKRGRMMVGRGRQAYFNYIHIITSIPHVFLQKYTIDVHQTTVCMFSSISFDRALSTSQAKTYYDGRTVYTIRCWLATIHKSMNIPYRCSESKCNKLNTTKQIKQIACRASSKKHM